MYRSHWCETPLSLQIKAEDQAARTAAGLDVENLTGDQWVIAVQKYAEIKRAQFNAQFPGDPVVAA